MRKISANSTLETIGGMFDGLIRLWSEEEKKKGRKNTRYPSGVEQHIFPNEIPWQGVYVEKTGIGVTKQKTTRTEAYSCERWPDTDKFWGRGTNVSQRRHSASFIRAGRKGGGEKKKSYCFISVPPILLVTFSKRVLVRIEDGSRFSRTRKNRQIFSRSFRIFCTIAYALHEFSRPFFNVIPVQGLIE